MRKTFAVAALFILPGAWWVHAPYNRDEARLCTPSTMRTLWQSSGGQSGRAVLAVATDAWWEMTRVSLPFFEPWEPPPEVRVVVDGIPRVLLVSRPPPDTALYRAQRFVGVASGAGSKHDLESGSGFLAVPVGGGPCLTTWPRKEREWIAPGDTVTFLLDPEDAEIGPNGEPIFLVSTLRGPNPGSRQAGSEVRSGARAELSGRQFFEFLHALPLPDRVRADPASAVADFRSWVVENADSTAYPVAEVLRGLSSEPDR